MPVMQLTQDIYDVNDSDFRFVHPGECDDNLVLVYKRMTDDFGNVYYVKAYSVAALDYMEKTFTEDVTVEGPMLNNRFLVHRSFDNFFLYSEEKDVQGRNFWTLCEGVSLDQVADMYCYGVWMQALKDLETDKE